MCHHWCKRGSWCWLCDWGLGPVVRSGAEFGLELVGDSLEEAVLSVAFDAASAPRARTDHRCTVAAVALAEIA